ncbi:MAG: restriction endonuclease subunit M, partial [Armatimonadia bacterium]|nr:restriction endonuclease subunit M [Armatimonadia bacterium]
MADKGPIERIPAPDETKRMVEALVERYAGQADYYASSSYNETEARRDFIDPFFSALGWDVANEQGYAEPYREVIHEDAIRVGRDLRAPDYCFRVGGRRMFFVEAKKPSVSLKGDPAPAYQLRRYGWSAHLPISALTDFEELAVYECAQRPKPTEGAEVARVDYLSYTDYLDRIDDIYWIFSKEAIFKGAFDRYAEGAKRKRGTQTVDQEFLAEIEAWRETLAKD